MIDANLGVVFAKTIKYITQRIREGVTSNGITRASGFTLDSLRAPNSTIGTLRPIKSTRCMIVLCVLCHGFPYI